MTRAHSLYSCGFVRAEISILFMPLGLALAGPAADVFGVDATLIGGAVLAVAANVALLMIPEVWRIGRAPEPN